MSATGPGWAVAGRWDPHVHLLSGAAWCCSVDCSPAAVRSVGEIVARVREAAAHVAPGAWVRAVGYDEAALAEQRHPTRDDLDRAAPRHPVRLQHRTGHLSVLSSEALRRCGIGESTDEPPGAAIERDLASGRLTGVLVQMEDRLSACIPPLGEAELRAGFRRMADRCAAGGVTGVVDASHTNDTAALALIERLAEEAPWLAVRAMIGGAAAGALRPREVPPRMRAGWAKVMLRELGEDRVEPVVPRAEGLVEWCRELAARGWAVAVHAVSESAVRAAAAALEHAPRPGRLPHRIEHAAVCPPDVARRIAAAGIQVVSNPLFLWENGGRYLQTVPRPLQPWLYDVGGMLALGVKVRAGSDLPVAWPNVPASVYAAATRRSRHGSVVPGRGLDARRAWRIHPFRPRTRAWWDRPPRGPDGLPDPSARVLRVEVDGVVAWRAGEGVRA